MPYPCPFCRSEETEFRTIRPSPEIGKPIYYVKCAECGGEGPESNIDWIALRLWNATSQIVGSGYEGK